MKLYHGTSKKLETLKRQQTQTMKRLNSEGKIINEGDLLNAIYFTPKFGFALAMGARPEGHTKIDNSEDKITFEKLEFFDPEKDVYIYEIDSEDIPESKLRKVDETQYVVDMDEVVPTGEQKLKAEEVLKYYELVNWKGKELHREIRLK